MVSIFKVITLADSDYFWSFVSVLVILETGEMQIVLKTIKTFFTRRLVLTFDKVDFTYTIYLGSDSGIGSGRIFLLFEIG